MVEESELQQNAFSQFARIYCIHLVGSTGRRLHIQQEFDRVGIGKYEFIEGFDKNSTEVNELYRSDFVKKYPPCFRCGSDSCNCANKSIFRPQVGNWLSHMKAWKRISEMGPGLALVCEDDVKFQDYVQRSLAMLARSLELRAALDSARPVLVRLGWALCDEHALSHDPELTQDIKMSNPCYAMNAIMADLALKSLKEISTTSDVFLHQQLASQVSHFTVMPPPAYELSWSTGDFVSEIRPKEERLNNLQKQLDMLEPHSPEYEEAKAAYKKELSRLEQYDKYNESPTLDYEDEYQLI